MFSLEEINNLTNDTSISSIVVEQLFDIIENPGRGNCLFYSLSQLLFFMP